MKFHICFSQLPVKLVTSSITADISMLQFARPSVCLSVYPMPYLKMQDFRATYGYCRTLIGNSMLEVKEVAETGTKPSPSQLQKHSLGGCTVNIFTV